MSQECTTSLTRTRRFSHHSTPRVAARSTSGRQPAALRSSCCVSTAADTSRSGWALRGDTPHRRAAMRSARRDSARSGGLACRSGSQNRGCPVGSADRPRDIRRPQPRPGVSTLPTPMHEPAGRRLASGVTSARCPNACRRRRQQTRTAPLPWRGEQPATARWGRTHASE